MKSKTKVDIVVIGINAEKTLGNCLSSIINSESEFLEMCVFYVDGGSTDSSVDIAKSFEGVKILTVESENPTPGRQRNAGWKAGTAGYIQFLDSDTLLNKTWLSRALPILEENDIGAVCGLREELNPEKSIYNWIANIEWNPAYGEIEEFGGDVLTKRDVLSLSAGYDDDLIAGEDPDLSYKIRKHGYRIIRLDTPMTKHDLSMYHLAQYWKRSYRSGHAFAEIQNRYKDMWRASVRRIIFRGGGFVFLELLSTILFIFNISLGILFCVLGFILLLRPRLFLSKVFKDYFCLTDKQAKLYAWHVSVVVLPQFFGILRYWAGRFFHLPLRNKRKLLSTGGIR